MTISQMSTLKAEYSTDNPVNRVRAWYAYAFAAEVFAACAMVSSSSCMSVIPMPSSLRLRRSSSPSLLNVSCLLCLFKPLASGLAQVLTILRDG